MADVCDPGGLCILQQQLLAQSLIAHGNLVSTTHTQDLDYQKSTTAIYVAAMGNNKAPSITAIE